MGSLEMGSGLAITHSTVLASSFVARPLRIEFPHAVYHVTSRGNARQKIVRHDDDRRRFLTTLAQVTDHFGWLCHAYCLMDNHYHLLIETPRANLSQGMRQLNGTYIQAFKRGITGWGISFKADSKRFSWRRRPTCWNCAATWSSIRSGPT
ncbi:MAG: transposase [Nitrospirota bacterium]|nr:transposase [Nitrospirota bacterium]